MKPRSTKTVDDIYGPGNMSDRTSYQEGAYNTLSRNNDNVNQTSKKGTFNGVTNDEDNTLQPLNSVSSRGRGDQAQVGSPTTAQAPQTGNIKPQKKEKNKILVLKELEGKEDYSSGDSGQEFPVVYSNLKQKQKLNRIMFYWKKSFTRGLNAAMISNTFEDIHQTILHRGTTNNLMEPHKYLNDRHKLASRSYPPLSQDSYTHLLWNVLMMGAILYTVTYVPYKIAFRENLAPTEKILDQCLDIFFGIDMIINFVSEYDDPVTQTPVSDYRKIAVNYLQGWFTLDFLAFFPFEELIKMINAYENELDPNNNAHVGMISLTKLPRLYRLVRFFRIFKMLRVIRSSVQLEQTISNLNVDPGYLRLAKTLGQVFFLCHLISCLWFLQARINHFQPDCWVVSNGQQDSEPFDQYMVSWYWVSQTITTVGFGDMSIGTSEEYIFATIWMLVGNVIYGFFVGQVTTLLDGLNQVANKQAKKIEIFSSYAIRIDLPEDLIVRVHRYLENDANDQNNLQDQDQLTQELPTSLKVEVMAFTNAEIINTIVFFSTQKADFLRIILPILRARIVYEKDILYSQGDISEEIFFLLNGSFTLYTDLSRDVSLPPNVINPKVQAFNVPVIMYQTGSYFGDMDSLIGSRGKQTNQSVRTRLGTMEASDPSEILVISRKTLEGILKQFPNIKNYMIELAEEKLYYYKQLVSMLVKLYRTKNKQKELISQRMKTPELTTYLSLKEQIIRKRESMNAINEQMQQAGPSLQQLQSKNLYAKGAKSLEQRLRAQSILEDFKARKDTLTPEEQQQAADAMAALEGDSDEENVSRELVSKTKKKARPQRMHVDDYSDGLKGVVQNYLSGDFNSKKEAEIRKHEEEQKSKYMKMTQRVLENSQDHFESCCGDAFNNFSAISLNAIEINNRMAQMLRLQQNQTNLVKNIDSQVKYAASKSENLKKRFADVTGFKIDNVRRATQIKDKTKAGINNLLAKRLNA